MTSLQRLAALVVGLGLLLLVAVLVTPAMSIGMERWLDGADSGDKLVALVGAFSAIVTACTVVVTARIAVGRLSHEREENAKNRSLELKKEVMLEAVRGLSAQVAAVGNIAVVESPVEETSRRFQESGYRVSAAYAVASPRVVAALRACSKAAAHALVSSLGERSAVQNLYSNMTVADDLQKKTAERTGRLVDEHAAAVARGADAREVATLKSMVDSSLEQSRRFSEERDEAFEALTVARVPFMRDVANKLLECENALRLAVAAIRIDMGVDLTSDEYLLSASQDADEMRQMIDSIGDIASQAVRQPDFASGGTSA